MISGQQLKQVLGYVFTNGSSFLAPTGTFLATPSTYPDDSLPISIVLNGTLVPNDAINITWTITNNVGTILLTGVGNTVSYTLLTIPSTIGSHNFNWNISYQDSSLTNYSLILTTNIFVSTSAKIGQLANPSDDIVISTDLTPLIESTLLSVTQNTVINLFAITCTNIGKIVIVVPDSYGNLLDIEDNTNSTVLNQFNVITDITNNRKIYVSIANVTPDTYYYKLIF